MTIVLPPDLETALAEQADRLGTSVELLAVDALRARFSAPPDVGESVEGAGTLADFLSDRIGILESTSVVPGGARMSENIREKVTDILLKKRRENRI